MALQLYSFKFKLLTDKGAKTVSTVAYDVKSAVNLVSRAENCPEHAMKLLSRKAL